MTSDALWGLPDRLGRYATWGLNRGEPPMPGPTDFIESNALLAVLDDPEQARTIVATRMLPGERMTLSRQAQALADLCDRVQREYEAAHGTCTATRGCLEPANGYFYQSTRRPFPTGVCAGHRASVEGEGLTVHEMPEVIL